MGPDPEAVCTHIMYMLADGFHRLTVLVGEHLVVMFRTDAGKEFWNKEVSTLLRSEYILPKPTSRYDPQSE